MVSNNANRGGWVQVLQASGALEDAAWSPGGGASGGGDMSSAAAFETPELAVGGAAAGGSAGSTWSTQTLAGGGAAEAAAPLHGDGGDRGTSAGASDKEVIKRTLSAVFQPLQAGCEPFFSAFDNFPTE